MVRYAVRFRIPGGAEYYHEDTVLRRNRESSFGGMVEPKMNVLVKEETSSRNVDINIQPENMVVESNWKHSCTVSLFISLSAFSLKPSIGFIG